MTRRLSELFGRVIALDVSPEMLARAQENLADRDNVDWMLGSGCDLAGVPDASCAAVFSYITLQHVPHREAVLAYLRESARVLAPGGRAGLQVRHPGWRARLLDVTGHAGRALRGRATLAAEWRGTRIPVRDLTAAVKEGGAAVTVRPHGPRHLWVIADRRHPVRGRSHLRRG